MTTGPGSDPETAAGGARFAVLTVGCGKNEADSDQLARVFATAGHVPAPPDEADVIVVNTCGFIDAAKEESIDAILAAAATASRTGARLAVVGCLVSVHGDELAVELPEVHAWSPGRPGPVLALLDEAARRPGRPATRRPDRPATGARRRRRLTHAYVKISDGCDTGCAFCTIPRIKGGYEAVAPARIREAARAAVSAGARELALVGQDTARWSWPGYGDLRRLMRELAGLAEWLRLLYLQPQHIDDAALAALAAHAVPYVDVPLQHASEAILAAMHRSGSGESHLRLLERIRAAVPGAAVRSTFLVGFPGETERHVEELLQFIAAAGIAVAGVFVFDPQPGTAAATLRGRVPAAEAEQRAAAVNDALAVAAAPFWQGMEGCELEVLVERGTRTPDGEAVGRTVHQAPDVDGVTYIRGSALRRGQMVRVRIEQATGWDLHGRVVGTPRPGPAPARRGAGAIPQLPRGRTGGGR